MSMNLRWALKKKEIIDFPFQTPTELTHSVLNENDKNKQLKLLKDFFVKRLNQKDPDDVEWGNDVIESIREKLFDINYQLILV